jgi:phospholipid N-methyltransferase
MQSKDDEISILKDNKILHETENRNSINNNVYSLEIWADAFWRRRNNHAKRLDPEIDIVLSYSPSKVLEIGPAYGRVTRKLIETANYSMELSGIELNQYFEKYTNIYAGTYPSLNSVNFIFDDFMEFRMESGREYDLIVFPMNTFPSFPIEKLSNLFDSVKYNLQEDGTFVFSTNKFPHNVDKYSEHSYGGELLVELKQDPIAGTFYTFPGIETEFGYQLISYSIYTRFDNVCIPKERIVNRSINNFYRPEILEQLINENGFIINSIDNSSHSSVYCLQNE